MGGPVIRDLGTIPDARIHFNRNGNGRDVNLYITGDNPQPSRPARASWWMRCASCRSCAMRASTATCRVRRSLISPAPGSGVTARRHGRLLERDIRIATLGELDQNSAKFSLADRQVPIRVSLAENTRHDLSTLENLPVPTAGGGAVPLKAVADISFGQGPTRVRRYNQARRLSIVADLNGVKFGPAMEKIKALPALKNLPPGVRQVDVGDAKYMAELVTNS